MIERRLSTTTRDRSIVNTIERGLSRKDGTMPKCGQCGSHYGELMVKHADICEEDSKALARPYGPEIDDLIRMEEEGNE